MGTVKQNEGLVVGDALVMKATRQALAQTMGDDYMTEHGYLEGISAEQLVTIGKDVTDTEATTDNYSKALAKQIGLVVCEALNEMPEPIPMELNNIEWGGLVEYALVGNFDVLDDPMFNPTKGQGALYAQIEHDAYLPNTYAKIFDKQIAKMIPMSLPIGQGNNPLAQAFTSSSQYTSYVGAVMQALANTITAIKYALSHTLASVGIAISNNATHTARHLLTEAIAKGILAQGSTATDFLKSEDALSFMIGEMRKAQNRMTVETTAFNNGSMPVAIPKSRQQLIAIDDIMTDVGTIVKRTSYNDEFASIDYYPIASWQSVKTNNGAYFDYDAITSISLAADPNNTLGYGTEAVELTNCVALLYAKGSLAYRTFYQATTIGNTGCTGLTTQFHHEAYSMAVNPVLPIVAFMLD